MQQKGNLPVHCLHHHPEKTIPHHVQWTVGGDRVEYDGNVSTKTANIVTDKLLFHSIMSTPNGHCMIGDLKDLYLGTPMQAQDYAFMQIISWTVKI